MRILLSRLRLVAARFAPPRALIAALLLGPLAGALIAYGAVGAEPAGGNAVNIDNFTFEPVDLTVTAGTTVTWLNRDDIPHTVVESNKVFRSKPLDTDNSYSFTFASAGTFSYFCSLHPKMTGRIIVRDKSS